MYSAEKSKRDSKSEEQVFNIINRKYGTSVSKSTVQSYVKALIVGESPMKKGSEGGLTKDSYLFFSG